MCDPLLQGVQIDPVTTSHVPPLVVAETLATMSGFVKQAAFIAFAGAGTAAFYSELVKSLQPSALCVRARES